MAVLINRPAVLAACLLLAIPARAEEVPQPPPVVDDVVYKGLVGKALDAVPMDPEERAALQRGSTVVSSTLTGRSLAVWVGLSNPALMIVGLVWGLFSASNIKAEKAGANSDTNRVEPPKPVEPAASGQSQVVALTGRQADEAAKGPLHLKSAEE